MRLRTIARIAAMKYLYERDMTPDDPSEDPAEDVNRARIPKAYAAFSLDLIEGCLRHREDLDRRIAEAASNWDLGRMAAIDRNLLRIAVYEMTHVSDVPPRVSIHEAVDLAKRYSTGRSGAFVNGILDFIYTKTKRTDDVRTD